MKALICVLVILLVMVSCFFWHFQQTSKICNSLNHTLNEIIVSIENQDNTMALTHSNRLNEVWEKQNNRLMIFANHKELDDISHTLIKIQTRLRTNNADQAIEEVEIAKQMISDIVLREIPSAVNIF